MKNIFRSNSLDSVIIQRPSALRIKNSVYSYFFNMSLLQILREDYAHFPANQTYSIYAQDVFFKDPLNQFRGVDRYKLMIGFIERWFVDTKFELHNIEQIGDEIKTRWTLSWSVALPWKPRISIDGSSELRTNGDQLIVSHIDYWDCSRFNVLKQVFLPH